MLRIFIIRANNFDVILKLQNLLKGKGKGKGKLKKQAEKGQKVQDKKAKE